jgi:hypothetical protein
LGKASRAFPNARLSALQHAPASPVSLQFFLMP